MIRTELMENDNPFTGRFTVGSKRKPSEHPLFDQECYSMAEHRLVKAGRPQTNETVEHFNGRI